jgi:hypothetical protein
MIIKYKEVITDNPCSIVMRGLKHVAPKPKLAIKDTDIAGLQECCNYHIQDLLHRPQLNKIQAKHLKSLQRLEVMMYISLNDRGNRVGFYPGLQIDDRGNYYSYNKGKDFTGTFSPDTAKKIRELGITDMHEKNIGNLFKGLVQTAYKEHYISTDKISFHSLRSYYITKQAEDVKFNPVAMADLSHWVNHSCLTTTLGYIHGSSFKSIFQKVI